LYYDAVQLAEEDEGRSLKASEVDKYWRRRALEFMRDEPGAALRLMLKKLGLFWGGPAGFSADRKLNILGRGVHFRKTTDEIGHVYNRGFLFDYVSSAYNYRGKQPLWISWKAEEPHRSKVKFQVRVAQSRAGLEKAVWRGAKGKDTYFTNRNSSLKHLPKGSWMQYRAVLDTYNGVHSPILDAVVIAFE